MVSRPARPQKAVADLTRQQPSTEMEWNGIMNERLLGGIVIAFALSSGCPAETRTPMRARDLSFVAIQDKPELPRVLLIGDSISMGYTLAVRKLLEGRVNLHRPPENCRSTRQTGERIESYLGTERWDVIHFNCGIHDLTLVGPDRKGLRLEDGGVVQVPLDEYRRNLEQIVRRLQRTGATLVWASITPVSEVNAFRRPQDVVTYNATAAEVMAATGVETNDLYSFALKEIDAGRMQWKDGVHFGESASAALALLIANKIEKVLKDRVARGAEVGTPAAAQP